MVALTDPSGAVANRYAYDPYGNRIASGTTGSVGNPFQFAGGYRDTTGFYKFGARYYDPNLGRWTQRDPVAGSISEPSTLNRYSYAGNNPVNFVDSTGREWWDPKDWWKNKKSRACVYWGLAGAISMGRAGWQGAVVGASAGCAAAVTTTEE